MPTPIALCVTSLGWPIWQVRTPQFWMMYLGFGLSITGAYGIISSSTLILTECFNGDPPSPPPIELAACTMGLLCPSGIDAINSLGGWPCLRAMLKGHA